VDVITKIISFALEEASYFRTGIQPDDLEAGLDASELGKIW
jgi:hypothetical protein